MKKRDCIYFYEDIEINILQTAEEDFDYQAVLLDEICNNKEKGGPFHHNEYDCDGCPFFTTSDEQVLYSSETHPQYAKLKSGVKIKIHSWTDPSITGPHRQELYYTEVGTEDSYFCYLDEVEEFLDGPF